MHHDSATIARIATRACGEMVSGTNGSGMVKNGVRSAATGEEPAEVVGKDDRADRDRAGEPGDERRPAGEKRRERAECRVQVDVLAAGAGTQRRQLRIGHRAGEREQAAGQPCEQEPPRVGHAGRHLRAQ